MSSDALGIELEEWLRQDLESLDGRALTGRLARLEQLTTKVRAAALAALGEFDDRGLHLLEFAPTAKSWLTAQVGIGARTAAGSVHVAKALRRMPLVAEAFASGRISEDHVRLLMRCAKPRTFEAFCRDEALLVGHAERLLAADLDTAVQRWLLANDPDGNEPRDPDEDEVSFSRVGDRFKLNGDFGIERGLEIDAALREKLDVLFRRDRRRAQADPFDPAIDRSPAQRRAEALADLIGLGAAAPSNTKRRKPLVVIHATENPDGDIEYVGPNGTILPLSVARHFTEDAHLTRVVFSARGALLDLGRSARVASEAMRTALVARDGTTCGAPGCDVPHEQCDAHHVIWWEHLGTTCVDNLVLACRHHHRRVHHGHLHVHMDDTGRPVFTDAMGRELRTQQHRHPPPDANAA